MTETKIEESTVYETIFWLDALRVRRMLIQIGRPRCIYFVRHKIGDIGGRKGYIYEVIEIRSYLEDFE